ncbi:MAG: CDP-glycerol glycerophosphotransferase family protein [Eggerthellaceae bacterium]|nr:CDP-glycerol glycerophosphotransferase family protein [Eggerthellaceae bacterium]
MIERIKASIWRYLDAREVRKARARGAQGNKVLAICRLGMGYFDNPKYIIDALERLYPGKYSFTLLVQQPIDGVPPYMRQVELGTRQALVELASAKLWLSDTRFNWPLEKAPDQYYVQTWHAGMGPKIAEGAAQDKLSQAYLDIAMRDGKMTDFMFANDSVHAKAFAQDYWQKGPVLRCGIPRNRPLLYPDVAAAVALRRSLGVPSGNGLLLYAPTFRNDQNVFLSPDALQQCAHALEARFGMPFSIAYRLHTEAQGAQASPYPESFIDTSSVLDSQDILCATDVLISDYSSIMEDFILLGRPCFSYAPDLADYLAERGLYYPLDMRPAPLAQTESELVAAIESFDNATFQEKRQNFFAQFKVTEDGQGDVLVARFIDELISQDVPAFEVYAKCVADGLFNDVLKTRGQAPAVQPLAAEWDREASAGA